MLRCFACKRVADNAMKMRFQTANREWKKQSDARWRHNNPEKSRERVLRWQKTERGIAYRKAYVRPSQLISARSRGLLRPALLRYPFIQTPRPEHGLLLLANSLVSQAIPGREDIVQEICLALVLGTTCEEALRAGGVKEFIRRFRAGNYEGRGYAVSLDVPLFSGRSLHDVLAEASDD
jgi:hypothetical protein